MSGAPHVALAHKTDGIFDTAELIKRAKSFSGLEGLDLAKNVTCRQSYKWDEMRWAWPKGFEKQNHAKYKVVAICLLYTSPSPRDRTRSRMPSSA